MKYHIFLLIALLSFPCYRAGAQLLPKMQPEQDACNAISVCGGKFSTPYSYHGAGRQIEQSQYAASPGCFSESNSVWLTLTVARSGTVAFTIVPFNSENDYDFSVFDITGVSCSDINGFNRIRCNGADINSCYNGFTGLSNNTAGTETGPGTGADFISSINATTGRVYLILIDNFIYGSKVAGFAIDFSASTAQFVQPKPAVLSYATTDLATGSEVTVHLTSKVRCNSIAADGSDFSIPGATIISAAGQNCRAGGYTSEIVLTLDAPLLHGSYMLHAQQGTDSNTVADFCNSSLALPDSVSFTTGIVPSDAPVTTPAVTTIAQLPASKEIDPEPDIIIAACKWRNITNTGTVATTRFTGITNTLPGVEVTTQAETTPQVAEPTAQKEPEPENTAIAQTTTTTPADAPQTKKFIINLDIPNIQESWAHVTAPAISSADQSQPVVGQPKLKSFLTQFKPSLPTTQPKPAPVTAKPKPAPVVTQQKSAPAAVTRPKPTVPDAPGSMPLLVTRWRKLYYIGVVSSPKYSIIRRRFPRIAEIDAARVTTPVPVPVIAQKEPDPIPVPVVIADVTNTENVEVVIPDTFSPNGDGTDDSFKPHDIKFLRMVEFTVASASGQEVFSSRENTAAWDGRYNGQLQPAAIYKYTIRLAWPDGRIETHNGNVELLK